MDSEIQLLGRQWKSQYLAIMFPFGWLLTQGDKPRSTLLDGDAPDLICRVCVCVLRYLSALFSIPTFLLSFAFLFFPPVCWYCFGHVCDRVWTCVLSLNTEALAQRRLCVANEALRILPLGHWFTGKVRTRSIENIEDHPTVVEQSMHLATTVDYDCLSKWNPPKASSPISSLYSKRRLFLWKA